MKKLLTVFVDGRGEEPLSSCIVTIDRGYGKEKFMKLLSEFDIGSVLIIYDSLLQAHPFRGKSSLNPAR